jgi:hypothetical protein
VHKLDGKAMLLDTRRVARHASSHARAEEDGDEAAVGGAPASRWSVD